VVGAEESEEAVFLTGTSKAQPLIPGHALLPLDHQADFHVPPRGDVLAWLSIPTHMRVSYRYGPVSAASRCMSSRSVP
jgi:hypothetical protein